MAEGEPVNLHRDQHCQHGQDQTGVETARWRRPQARSIGVGSTEDEVALNGEIYEEQEGLHEQLGGHRRHGQARHEELNP